MSKQLEKFSEKKVIATDFFSDLSDVMDSKMRLFLRKYVTDHDNAQSAMLLMKSYDVLYHSYSFEKGSEPSKEEMAILMTELMTNSDYRKKLVNEWELFIKNKDGLLTGVNNEKMLEFKH